MPATRSSSLVEERRVRPGPARRACGCAGALVRGSVRFVASTLLVASALLAPPHAQAADLDSALDGLVADVLEANLEVEGAEAVVAQRLAALDAARARYLPSLDLEVRYSRATGGREIDIPVGDLLNPVYSSLNEILESQGKPPAFPQVDNQTIPFLRPEEQNSALLLLQPLYDGRIPAARRAAESMHLAALGGLDALRGRLTRDTKQAYYRWLGLGEAVGILDATLETARANLAVNESLLRNGKITRDLVYRAEADLLEVEQQALAARNARVLGRAWVNLLRDQPFDAPLPLVSVGDGDVARGRARLLAEVDSPASRGASDAARAAASPGAASAAASRNAPANGPVVSDAVGSDATPLQDLAAARRPELRQLDAVLAAADAGEDAAKAALRPTLGLAVDAGAQAANFAFEQDDFYAIASLVLRFNLFRGGADAASIREAASRIDELSAARKLASQQVRIEVLEAWQAYTFAQSSLATAERREAAADAGLRIAEKKRDLGQMNQAEFIDARRAFTDAQLNRNRTRFEALAALAGLEYATGVAAGAPAARREETKP